MLSCKQSSPEQFMNYSIHELYQKTLDNFKLCSMMKCWLLGLDHTFIFAFFKNLYLYHCISQCMLCILRFGTEAEIQLSLKRFSDSSVSSLIQTCGRASRHQKLAPIPMVDDWLIGNFSRLWSSKILFTRVVHSCGRVKCVKMCKMCKKFSRLWSSKILFTRVVHHLFTRA